MKLEIWLLKTLKHEKNEAEKLQKLDKRIQVVKPFVSKLIKSVSNVIKYVIKILMERLSLWLEISVPRHERRLFQ